MHVCTSSMQVCLYIPRYGVLYIPQVGTVRTRAYVLPGTATPVALYSVSTAQTLKAHQRQSARYLRLNAQSMLARIVVAFPIAWFAGELGYNPCADWLTFPGFRLEVALFRTIATDHYLVLPWVLQGLCHCRG